MKNNRIIGLGEVLWDSYPVPIKQDKENQEKENPKKVAYYRVTLGGAPANFAYHAHSMGADATIISAVGNDYWGEKTVKSLAERGMKAILPQVPYETGLVDVIVREGQENQYDIRQNSAWDNIPITPEMEEAVRHARAICFGSLAQRSSVSRNTIQYLLREVAPKDCVKIFDINIREPFFNKEIIEQSLTLCTVLKLNEKELPLLCDMFGLPKEDYVSSCKMILKQFGLDIILYTCGANGSHVITPTEISTVGPEDMPNDMPKNADANTTGGGDSFTGSFCAALLAGKSIREAHLLATEVSAFVCTKNGAMPTMPEKYRNLLKS